MPPSIKKLMKQLEDAKFVNRGGKGSHRNYEHGNLRITISGKTGGDALPYQVKNVKKIIEESKK